MRIRTSLSIAILLGATAAVLLSLTGHPGRDAATTEGASAAAPQPAADAAADADDLYCTERTPANGVIVRTGPDCAHHGGSTGSPAPAVTVTREQGTLVITGADP
jgi:hypothetical protein